MTRQIPRSLITSLIVGASIAPSRAQPASPPDFDPQPVNLQIRLDPPVATRIAERYADLLKQRYELSDDQVTRIQSALARRLLTEAVNNQDACRTLMEATLTAMLTNRGQWSPAVAQEFARQIQPQFPALRETIGHCVDDIRAELTVGQSVRFAADYTTFSVAYAAFESRMKKWSKGGVGDYPNLFWLDETEDLPTTRPDGTSESRELAVSRKQAERNVKWMLDRKESWTKYVETAGAYYRFNEAQKNAAQAILKNCLERAKPYQTPERRRELEQCSLVWNLFVNLGEPDIWSSPFLTDLDDRSAALSKPMISLDAEFKLRVREIAYEEQRLAAEDRIYEKLEKKKGYKKPAAP